MCLQRICLGPSCFGLWQIRLDLVGVGLLQIRMDFVGVRGCWCVCRYGPFQSTFFVVDDGCCSGVLALLVT